MAPLRIKTNDPDCPADRSNGLRDGEGNLVGCYPSHAEATAAGVEAGLMVAISDDTDVGAEDADVDGR